MLVFKATYHEWELAKMQTGGTMTDGSLTIEEMIVWIKQHREDGRAASALCKAFW